MKTEPSRWVAAFESLAVRKATLRRVRASVYRGRPSWEQEEPWPEEQWREQWLRQQSEEVPVDADWPWSLWLDFGAVTVPRLSCTSHGEGFEFEVDAEMPSVGRDADAAIVRELTDLPPFAAVVGTPLQTMSVLGWPLDDEEEGARSWRDRSPHVVPVGMRLQFGRGELWIFNIADELETYAHRPPYWHKPGDKLDEYSIEVEL